MQERKYLLDTHCLLWFQDGQPKIPRSVMDIIQDPENIIYFTQLSLYEIAIKQKIGKLPEFNSDTHEIYLQAIKDGFTFLPIRNEHIDYYQNVPLHQEHRDPFDRLLIATAQVEQAIMISGDRNFQFYSELIDLLW